MRQRFLDKGFQDFIAKPLDRRALGQLLLRWVPEGRRQAKPGGEEHGTLNPNSFQIEGIDMEVAMRYYSGDEAGFAELLELYYMDGQRKIGLLRELAGTNLSDYQTQVHALKSASANIGAMGVSDMARAQENAAAQGDRAMIDRQLPLLLEAYGELLERIGKVLEQRRSEEPQEEKLPALPARELAQRVGEALEELENFRSRECAEIVSDILRHELPQDKLDSLTEIQGQLKLYEDDNAEKLLAQLLGGLEKQEEHE